MDQKQTLDISWGTILKISFALFVFYLIYLFKDILALSVFALIISLLLNPIIDFFQRYKLSHSLAIILSYVLIFGFLYLLICLLFPLILLETGQFSLFSLQYFERIYPSLEKLNIKTFQNAESLIILLGEFFEKISIYIFTAISAVFGKIGSILFIIAVAFFLSLEKKGVERTLTLLTPKKERDSVLETFEKCQKKVFIWFSSKVLSGIFIAILAFIAFKLFNVHYPFTFSALVGILEVIPFFGPLIALIIVFVFVLLDSWLKALFVLGAFLLIRQIEKNFLTPFFSFQDITLPPVLVLISLAFGGRLLGILGAILAVPTMAFLFEFWKDFLKKGFVEPSAHLTEEN